MLRKGDSLIGGLQIGVFADPNTAAAMFMDQIHHTSVGPNRRFGSELGAEAVGWWMRVNKDSVGFYCVEQYRSFNRRAPGGRRLDDGTAEEDPPWHSPYGSTGP